MLAMKRGELRLQPFAKQARSKEFMCATAMIFFALALTMCVGRLLLVFLSTYMLRSNFYIQSVGDHLRIMSGDDQSLRTHSPCPASTAGRSHY